MIWNVYFINSDDCSQFHSSHKTLASAQRAQTSLNLRGFKTFIVRFDKELDT